MDDLIHIGIARKSGRYPWGSGEDPYQSSMSFLGQVKRLEDSGLTRTEVAKGMGMSINDLVQRKSLATAEVRSANRAEAIKLKEKGMSNVAIGERMGRNESYVRLLLNEVIAERQAITTNVADLLREEVAQKKFIDIGKGVETHVGVAATKLNTAVKKLQDEGYTVMHVDVEQVGNPGKYTSLKVLGPPTEDIKENYRELYADLTKIKLIGKRSEDMGRTLTNLGLDGKPDSVSSKRLKVVYAEEGGTDRDGVIQLRRGVKDLDLGNSKYAQVRIMVDDTHFLKGMVVYKDDMPPGIDMMFNTNKSRKENKLDALKVLKADLSDPKVKEIKKLNLSAEETEKLINKGVADKSIRVDPDNPFGATISAKRGALNIVNEEGDWSTWSKSISSQVLSKQSKALAKEQLELNLKIKQDEFETIKSYTNPVIKKKLLEGLADDADSSAVHLKAAALPRQTSKVLLPIPSLKPNEVYAPGYRDGEVLALIRHPHGGVFEIPILTVNNKNREGKEIMGNNPKDSIGIHPKASKQMSGADNDGDTAIVIPNNTGKIRASAPLKALENFDPQESYKGYEGMKVISSILKNRKMGEITNLINDMTIKGATDSEIAMAVKHSMVIIDSEKHKLNYKQSYLDNNIRALEIKYQPTGGVSTLISRAKSQQRVDARKNRVTIDPTTGEKIYTPTGETYTDKKGRLIVRQEISTKMAEAKDARTLSSGTLIEEAYASYANGLKQLGNKARLEALKTPNMKYSPSAKKAYAEEVKSLDNKLNAAYRNKPIERQAQVIADSILKQKKLMNPDMDNAEEKKVRGQALGAARANVGKNKFVFEITDSEWNAIQAGAITNNKLKEILDTADIEQVKRLATPRTKTGLSSAQASRAKSMSAKGYTTAEIADSLGVSTSTIDNIL